MEQVTLQVNGMTCQGCVRSVKRVLEAVPGVVSAEVSLERNQAVIACDPARIDAARLAEAVTAAGYSALPA
jgi:copper chaperone